MPARLHVNIDHVATIRQQRFTRYPEPLAAASIAEMAGAHGITVHLREDRRHIQDRDVRMLRETVQTLLNFEMAMTQEMQDIAVEVKAETVTLVPESREELTTEGGFDVIAHHEALAAFLPPLQAVGSRVSLFIDPDIPQIDACKRVGVDLIELSSASYCEAENAEERAKELARLREAAEYAHGLGLEVAVGHGLDYTNVEAVATIPEIVEFNIGHSIVARAIFVGLHEAVREMLRLLGHPI
ncbi:MAG TPA: pyridoxine 5'-phosphate synthase [Myxococcales bacterium]|nr:pyridoxine 5'-phosphate synthase [Deltaproteobacteria bacterium]MBU48307.1 pyridoxine 5'-phosphate synthase [Deltaproteobacteria bacterium]HAA54202.1 pyridoxine 5'-phosphate synthase [Myxococcales bacterium]|tara:strand:+ start:15381 stop:16106 length:726 start_codon:yes stop_codon:yes gene_type:complete